jgi:hypothetical protein
MFGLPYNYYMDNSTLGMEEEKDVRVLRKKDDVASRE